MVRINLEGQIVKEFAKIQFTPLNQGMQPFLKDTHERVFTVVQEDKEEMVWMFDGSEWLQVS